MQNVVVRGGGGLVFLSAAAGPSRGVTGWVDGGRGGSSSSRPRAAQANITDRVRLTG